MEKIIVHITWLDNYGAYSDVVDGCVATNDTLEGVKQAYREALELHLQGMREDGDDIPSELQGPYELIFVLNTQALLKHYDGILTRAAISRLTGINEKQLGHYIQGIRTPRKEQRTKIINGLHSLARELESVE
ncbi:type II toxin-antitoxin system HicB family antitoxin [Parabacteroides pacaensis]|uniref:type II toxin-antitoxin system HicB family antitoxin n=1 Tax=Parabacteroides pacaensis TaxID=2086575 RepID=UPI000D104CD9|nr:type II toxin-antitoxin system HicB family antitoxin [Parabacteroides pacaensis]